MSYETDQGILLYVLSGRQHALPQSMQIKRERGRVVRQEASFLVAADPDVISKVPERFKRSNPANPGMNEARAWARERERGRMRSHSHKIQDRCNDSGKFRTMSNKQKIRQPYKSHTVLRPIEPDEVPNVGPAATKK
jgi:hypothetical protein